MQFSNKVISLFIFNYFLNIKTFIVKKNFLSRLMVLSVVANLFSATNIYAQNWKLTGNFLTPADTGLLGTTNNKAVSIITNGANRLFINRTGAVGINTNNPLSKFHVSGAQTMEGQFSFTNGNYGIQFGNPSPGYVPMMNMFKSGTANADRMVLAHSPAFPNWGLQYQDATDQFNFLGQGNPVMSVNLYPGSVGIGTATPGAKFDIAGSGTYDLSGAYSDFRLGDATNNMKMGVANAGGGTGDGYLTASGRLYLGTSNTFANSQTLAINNNGTVGVGTFSPAGRLGIVGDVASTTPVLAVDNSYIGSVDVRGIQSLSKAADGYGYGIFSTGGYMGGRFIADAGAYSGYGYGVYGEASGTTATRIGVYGTASGGTENWGGYFPTKTYTNELRVGGTQGATGYVAAINGKLIATEVRVEATGSWPDYVFANDYKLTPLDELEAKLNADKHLPGVPSATEITEGGIMLGEMQSKTIEKVEENTLYILQLHNMIKELKKEIELLKKANK